MNTRHLALEDMIRDLTKMTKLAWLQTRAAVDPNNGTLDQADAAELAHFAAGQAWGMAQRLEAAFDAGCDRPVAVGPVVVPFVRDK